MTRIWKGLWILGVLLCSLALASCETLDGGQEGTLSASGIVEVTEVSLSAELPGRVVEVLVKEGDQVAAGQALFRLDGAVLHAQRSGAEAALQAAEAQMQTAIASRSSAEAALESAATAVQAAELQLQISLMLARAAEAPIRRIAWDREDPREFDLPPWYFEVPERIRAAEVEVVATEKALQAELRLLAEVTAGSGGSSFAEAERRLSQAQAAFIVADELRDRRIDTQDRKFVRDFVDDLYDAAEAELESAQEAYDSLLSDDSAEDVLEARARVAVARERWATAVDRLNELLTGEHSLEVQLAHLNLRQAELVRQQAETSIAQADAQVLAAEKAVEQAKSALELLELQTDRLLVVAPAAGVVMTRSIEPGELIQPGLVALTLGQLDELRLTVYLPEDRYGQVSVGDQATVAVDSFPDVSFDATVTRIADRAEFTPRNVQTEEDRRTTVYAIELAVADASGRLKPGMPADVTFAR